MPARGLLLPSAAVAPAGAAEALAASLRACGDHPGVFWAACFCSLDVAAWLIVT